MAVGDLVAALKNAVERGENLDKACKSLINAGYKSQDVDAARQIVSKTLPSQQHIQRVSIQPLQTAQMQTSQRPQFQTSLLPLPRKADKNSAKKNNWLIISSIAIVSALIILIIGILFAILFG